MTTINELTYVYGYLTSTRLPAVTVVKRREIQVQIIYLQSKRST
jgi:hypothetical protein